MKKRILFLTSLLLGFTNLFYNCHAQTIGEDISITNLKSHIGLNLSFSTTNDWNNAVNIVDYFREFHTCRNGTQGSSYLYPFTSEFPNSWPTAYTLGNPNINYGQKYLYDFSNFTGRENGDFIGLYKKMEDANKMIYPAFAEIHQYLSTNAYHTNDNPNNYIFPNVWEDNKSRKRKAIPHEIVEKKINGSLQLILRPVEYEITNSNGDTVTIVESYTKENSYRFFGEYLSNYSILFGKNKMDFDGSKLYMNTEVGNNNGPLGREQVNYIEIWNEPDSWWAWNSLEGYYTPEELATCVSSVFDGHGGTVTTDIYNDQGNLLKSDFPSGFNDHSDYSLITPGLHEMNVGYLSKFLDSLEAKRILLGANVAELNFQVANFHHYSAYKESDLMNTLLISEITPDKIVEKSLESITYTNNVGVLIDNVALETTITGDLSEKIWIHPELDGYKKRGKILRELFQLNGISIPQIWVTEWGYPSYIQIDTDSNKDAKYPNGDISQKKWITRGFIEYQIGGIDKSFWHWYQDDVTSVQWDTRCGIVDENENRKPAWYHLCTLQELIGDLGYYKQHDVDGCGEYFAYSLQPPSFSAIHPNVSTPFEKSCPRIYQYRGSQDCTFYDDVWVTWLPVAGTLTHNKRVYIDELDILYDPSQFDFIGELFSPNHYTITTPLETINEEGKCFMESEFIEVKKEDETNRLYITVGISETPSYIKFYSLRSNQSVMDGYNCTELEPEPNTCSLGNIQFTTSTLGCHSAAFTLTADFQELEQNGCQGYIIEILYNGTQIFQNQAVEITGLEAGSATTIEVTINLTKDGQIINSTVQQITLETIDENCFDNPTFENYEIDEEDSGCTKGYVNALIEINNVNPNFPMDLEMLCITYSGGPVQNGEATYDWDNFDFETGTIQVSLPFETMPGETTEYTIQVLKKEGGTTSVIASLTIPIYRTCNDCLDEEMLEIPTVNNENININIDCENVEVCFYPVAETICETIDVYPTYIINIEGIDPILIEVVDVDLGDEYCTTLDFAAEEEGIGDFGISIGTTEDAPIITMDSNTFSNESCCKEETEVSVTNVISTCWATTIQLDFDSPEGCESVYTYSFESSYEDCYTTSSQFYDDHPTIQASDIIFVLEHPCFFVTNNFGDEIKISLVVYGFGGEIVSINEFTIAIEPLWITEGKACKDIPIPDNCPSNDPGDTNDPCEYNHLQGSDNNFAGRFKPILIGTSCEHKYADVYGHFPKIDKRVKNTSPDYLDAEYLLFSPNMDLIRQEYYNGIFNLSIPEPLFNEDGKLDNYLLWFVLNDHVMEFSYPDIYCGDNEGGGSDDGRQTREVLNSSNNGRKVNIYPNPSKDNIKIKLLDVEYVVTIKTIKILDVNGRTILNNINLNHNEYEITKTDDLKGAYIIQIELSDGQIIYDKIVFTE